MLSMVVTNKRFHHIKYQTLMSMNSKNHALFFSFSHTQPYQLLTLEQTQSSRAKYLLEVCIYELYGEEVSQLYHILISFFCVFFSHKYYINLRLLSLTLVTQPLLYNSRKCVYV